MTKAKFMDHCRRSTGPLRVDIGTEYRGTNRQVMLYGIWANRSILDVVLYTPTPGQQWRDSYAAANRLCEEGAKKFQRWLNEFTTKRTTISNVGDRTKINNDTMYQAVEDQTKGSTS